MVSKMLEFQFVTDRSQSSPSGVNKGPNSNLISVQFVKRKRHVFMDYSEIKMYSLEIGSVLLNRY